MKVSAAIWMAMAWAAIDSVPIQPITNTAALNTVISSASVTAIGRPIRHTSRKRCQSARQKRPNSR